MNKYKTVVHPNRYIWDFWYYYDNVSKVFHLFYLNADPETVQDENFHEVAEIGYAVTKDFINIDWGNYNVLSADKTKWYNSSIWSGDIIKIKNGYLLFFTSKDKNIDDGFTQNIGAAYSKKISTDKWQIVENIRIQPDPVIYEPKSVKGDSSIHSWRDPYLFIYENQIHMLISAKTINSPLNKKGAIALLRSKDSSFNNWEILKPLSNPDSYPEMEVSQLFINSKGEFELVFSSSFKHNAESKKNKIGGLYSINSKSINNFNGNTPRELVKLKSNLYACRVIPELGGEIIGFDIETGGIRRSGIKTGFKNVNRDFTNYDLVLHTV